jgi:hypothetical protein
MNENIEFQGEDEDYLIHLISTYSHKDLIKYISEDALHKEKWIKERELQ